MVLVLGYNFFFLQLSHWTKTVHHRIHSGRSGRNAVDCYRTRLRNCRPVRDSLTIKKKILMCKFIKAQIYFSTCGNNVVLSNSPRECTCTFELADVHQCNKVDFPCCCFVCRCMTSFHSLSTAAFASGINISNLGERYFLHLLSISRSKHL